MFAEGQLLKFDPFLFKNGNPSKPKFFIVLKHMEENLMMASLPTSHDHIPSDCGYVTGCVNIVERGVNAFIFNPGEQVTEQFAFPLRTYVYGEQVDEYNQSYLDSMGADVEDLGILKTDILNALRECVKQSPLIKRKYSKLL